MAAGTSSRRIPIPLGWGNGGLLADARWVSGRTCAATGKAGALARMSRQNTVMTERKTYNPVQLAPGRVTKNDRQLMQMMDDGGLWGLPRWPAPQLFPLA